MATTARRSSRRCSPRRAARRRTRGRSSASRSAPPFACRCITRSRLDARRLRAGREAERGGRYHAGRPGATRQRTFAAGAPGTYFYWGSTTHRPVADRNGIDSQLHGAFIVDSTATPPPDRVFVLGSWTGPRDTSGFNPELPRHQRRLVATHRAIHVHRRRHDPLAVGESDGQSAPDAFARVLFDVTNRGSWAADTSFAAGDAPRVVTQTTAPGGTYAMTWVPEEPGNWLLHCHVAFHTSMFLAATVPPDPADPVTVDHAHGMRGMVLAVTVMPGASSTRRPAIVDGARAIRLVAKAAPGRSRGGLDEMAFVRQDGDVAPPGDSVPSPSSLLMLRRGEPVRITVVNHLRAATGVHWHGIEVPAYSDGVPAWSGSMNRIAPVIAPGRFLRRRVHSAAQRHVDLPRAFERSLPDRARALRRAARRGLVGYDPTHERIILLGPDGPARALPVSTGGPFRTRSA